MAKNKPVTNALSQLDKFKLVAKELECDDDEKRFADRLGKLVRPPSAGQ